MQHSVYGKTKELPLRLMNTRCMKLHAEEACRHATSCQCSLLGPAQAVQSSDSQHCLQGMSMPARANQYWLQGKTNRWPQGQTPEGFFPLSSVIISYLRSSETTCIFSQASCLPVRTECMSLQWSLQHWACLLLTASHLCVKSRTVHCPDATEG